MTVPSQHKRVFLQTFGCQMNDYDSGKILEQLRAEAYYPTEDPAEADLILINTCAIREKAENKVYSLLGTLSETKKRKPMVKIGVGGCVAQQQGEQILRRAKMVDLVFGTDNIFDLPELLHRVHRGERVVSTEWRHRKQKTANFIPAFPEPAPGENLVKAGIAITKGCNNFCTFCVVPYTRGREVSREPENILAEARSLVRRGAREIMLLGQNVNSYRAGEQGFVQLLRSMNDIPGLERIRYTSPHPKDFGEELADAHVELPKLCEHLHLPFQAGSDRILKAMRRNHGIPEYLEKMAMMKQKVPEIALSTDIIVGFPGEEEEDFEGTLRVMREVRFDHLYAFKFSPRNDTPAASYAGQVPERVKAERLAAVHDLHESILAEKNSAFVHSRQEVLVEGPHPREKGTANGRTRGNKSTMVMDCELPPGTLVPVEIVATRKFSLIGREVGGG